VQRCAAAGIKASVIVLLGLGGRARSAEHAAATAEALNRMQPRYLSFLSLMLVPGTALAAEARAGHFEELSPEELLAEAGAIIEGLDLAMTVFRSDHASNHLPLEGRFPADKARLLAEVKTALAGTTRLRPEFLRGL
jgi:radical SAM superfamily enzyme